MSCLRKSICQAGLGGGGAISCCQCQHLQISAIYLLKYWFVTVSFSYVSRVTDEFPSKLVGNWDTCECESFSRWHLLQCCSSCRLFSSKLVVSHEILMSNSLPDRGALLQFCSICRLAVGTHRWIVLQAGGILWDTCESESFFRDQKFPLGNIKEEEEEEGRWLLSGDLRAPAPAGQQSQNVWVDAN